MNSGNWMITGFVIINCKYRVLFLCFQFLIPFLLLVFNYGIV